MTGATIRIFLTDGTPLGPRVIEKSNWTGRATDFARVDWPTARSRDEFGRPGVYVLRGTDDDGQARIYVGEADELRKRLNQHFSGPGSRDFWTRAVAFTSRDEHLNKAHVRYLESRLIALGHAAKRAIIENGTAPPLPPMSESDRAESEMFLEEMLVIYPLVGVEAFNIPTSPPPSTAHLQLKAKGIVATGADTPGGFVVFKGSGFASTESPGLHEYMRRIRETLVTSGVIVNDGQGLRVGQDYTFGSPSTAASVLLGHPTNGRTMWKDASGTPLKAIQEAQAAG